MESNPLIGAWRLVSYEGRTGDNVLYPLGEDATGYIMYTHDGHMSVAMMAAGRCLPGHCHREGCRRASRL